MIKKINLSFIFLLFFYNLFYGQNEQIKIDSSGIITIFAKDGEYLEENNWSCFITQGTQTLKRIKKSKNYQKTLSFFFPYDFQQHHQNQQKFDLIVKKDSKEIYNEKVYFDTKIQGNFKLYNQTERINYEEVKGEILDVYYFDSPQNKHIILRSILKNKRIYFYYFIDKEIVNIHTDEVNFSLMNKIENPIIVTDLDKDNKPEISLKYKTQTHNKIVLFIEKNKFICRKSKEKITYSEALNNQKNILIKQHLLNEILKKSE